MVFAGLLSDEAEGVVVPRGSGGLHAETEVRGPGFSCIWYHACVSSSGEEGDVVLRP